MENFIKESILSSMALKQKILGNEDIINGIGEISRRIILAYERNNKVLLFGNGGSAADAQHISSELVNKFRFDRPPLCAVALTANTSILTSISNDFGYDHIFERQIEAMAKKEDIVIGISTSGNPENISLAFKMAHRIQAFSIALLGKSGGQSRLYADISLIIPSDDTPRIQEAHILIGHIICDIVEKSLYGDTRSDPGMDL